MILIFNFIKCQLKYISLKNFVLPHSSTFSVSVKIEPNLDDDRSDTEADLVIDEREPPLVKSETRSEEKVAVELPVSWAGPRQCDNCDIRFNYLNTYMAHKQFYCKNSKERNNNSNSNSSSAGVTKMGSGERRESLTTPSPNAAVNLEPQLAL